MAEADVTLTSGEAAEALFDCPIVACDLKYAAEREPHKSRLPHEVLSNIGDLSANEQLSARTFQRLVLGSTEVGYKLLWDLKALLIGAHGARKMRLAELQPRLSRRCAGRKVRSASPQGRACEQQAPPQQKQQHQEEQKGQPQQGQQHQEEQLQEQQPQEHQHEEQMDQQPEQQHEEQQGQQHQEQQHQKVHHQEQQHEDQDQEQQPEQPQPSRRQVPAPVLERLVRDYVQGADFAHYIKAPLSSPLFQRHLLEYLNLEEAMLGAVRDVVLRLVKPPEQLLAYNKDGKVVLYHQAQPGFVPSRKEVQRAAQKAVGVVQSYTTRKQVPAIPKHVLQEQLRKLEPTPTGNQPSGPPFRWCDVLLNKRFFDQTLQRPFILEEYKQNPHHTVVRLKLL